MRKSLLLLILPTLLTAQTRYLVSPKDEVIPLKRGTSPAAIIAKRSGKTYSAETACGNDRFIFGYPETMFPPTSNFGAYHKDVMAEWFVMKASGRIDTIYWETLGSVGAKDSTIYMRIHNSRIGPEYGPGVRIPPHNTWAPPCQNWGYFIDTNEPDGGVTPFPEDATPPGPSTWTSTIAAGEPTEPPILEPLWGGSGFGVIDHAGRVNALALIDGGSTLNVTTGQTIFISQRVSGPQGHTNDARTEWAASGFHVDAADEFYPSRDWKFYMHDSGPSNCSGVGVNVKRGWTARGGFGSDSLDVAVFNIWYSMVVTTNTPPGVLSMTTVHNTFHSSPQSVDAEISDCDQETPSRAGVRLALLKWQVNGAPQTDLQMMNLGGLTWEASIPGYPAGTRIDYRVYAEDSTGLFSYGPPSSYQIISPSGGWARIDTSGPCLAKSIASNSANVIPPQNFFLPPGSGQTLTLDDGTAGPFDMGSNMPLFGDVGRYMWIGVNGGLAISKSATDIVDVNANGQYARWGFPYAGSLRHGGRSDTAGTLRMPGNFFAPLWEDLYHGDSAHGLVCGDIRFQRGFGGDTCLVIAEWDSIGTFEVTGPICDELTFRAIFNKCDGTIEYQYDDVGTYAENQSAIIGLEADSTKFTVPIPLINNQPPYLFLNESGYPPETRPRSQWCVKIYQSTITASLAGWNLISVSATVLDNRVPVLFPTANPPHAYTYINGVTVRVDSLFPGHGYWLRFSRGSVNIGAEGALIHTMDIPINGGWNLVGTIGFPVSTSGVTISGGATIISQFYEYTGGYRTTTTLHPGNGYWVKSSGSGSLHIEGGVPIIYPKISDESEFAGLNSISICDRSEHSQTLYFGNEEAVKEPLGFYELPPPMPEFDARFASGRMVETYPSRLTESASYQFPVHIQSEGGISSISWNISNPPEREIILGSKDGKLKNVALAGNGSLKITQASLRDLVISMPNKSIPKEFGLLQNYPNPFNPVTNIEFHIADRFAQGGDGAEFVTLRVFDMLGREVGTLVNEKRDPGVYTVSWDATNFASGLYFYRLNAGTFSDIKKLMLIK